jgi:hypothetical protein
MAPSIGAMPGDLGDALSGLTVLAELRLSPANNALKTASKGGIRSIGERTTTLVDERQIGRIYKERVPAGVKWLWSLQVARAPPPNEGIADTLDEAKEAFAKRYEEVKRGK